MMIMFLDIVDLGCCSSYSVLDTDCSVHNLLRIKRFDDISVFWRWLHRPRLICPALPLMRRRQRPPQRLHSVAVHQVQPPERRPDRQKSSFNVTIEAVSGSFSRRISSFSARNLRHDDHLSVFDNGHLSHDLLVQGCILNGDVRCTTPRNTTGNCLIFRLISPNFSA
jgi:hypothetical protein